MSRETIARILKEKRRASKMSVEEVADKLKTLYQIEISAKSLYSYESGHRQPDADLLLALCNIYGITDILQEFSFLEHESVDNVQNLKEKAPVSQENPEITEARAIRLYQALLSNGWIQEGEDITEEQLEVLDGISKILSALFNKSQ